MEGAGGWRKVQIGEDLNNQTPFPVAEQCNDCGYFSVFSAMWLRAVSMWFWSTS